MSEYLTYIIPILIQLPIAIGAIDIEIPRPIQIVEVLGTLQSLTSGPFTVEISRVSDGAVLAILNWDSARRLSSRIARENVDARDSLRFGITSIGAGALGCYIAVWFETS